MNRLNEIQQEYAERKGKTNWYELISDELLEHYIEEYYHATCMTYTKECIKASLEKASCNIELYHCNNKINLNLHTDDPYLTAEPGWYVACDKDSITNPENIILL